MPGGEVDAQENDKGGLHRAKRPPNRILDAACRGMHLVFEYNTDPYSEIKRDYQLGTASFLLL